MMKMLQKTDRRSDFRDPDEKRDYIINGDFSQKRN